MSLYCGIDLHSNNQVIVVIDDNDKRLLERRVPNELCATLSALEPFREDLLAVAVESTYNWYWLVDGLLDHGYSPRLVNTAAVQQWELWGQLLFLAFRAKCATQGLTPGTPTNLAPAPQRSLIHTPPDP